MDLDVRFLDPASWHPAEMHERMRWLRENDPVHWSERDGLWILTRYRDVEAASRNQALFTSAEGVRADAGFRIGLLDDPRERHLPLRKLLNRGFTPRRVAKLEERFRRMVREHVDRIAHLGECDFVEAIAVPLPLLIIAEMMGIRPQDRERFHRWSDDMIAGDGNLDRPEIVGRSVQAFLEYSTYLTERIEERRREPRDDLLSVLVGAKDEGFLGRHEPYLTGIEPEHHEELVLANDELVKLMVLLLVAGNETTRNAISGSVALLIEHPAERAELLRDPARIRPAVEEMLRLVSPVNCFSRTVTADTELGGRRLQAGQQVLLVYPSANRDAEVFPDPDSFRIDRNPQHLAFGVGNHFCLGANLARMEIRAVLEELLPRLPDLAYADAEGPVYEPSALVRSCRRMRVRYTPEDRQRQAASA